MATLSQELVPCSQANDTNNSRQNQYKILLKDIIALRDIVTFAQKQYATAWKPQDHPLTTKIQCQDTLTAIDELYNFCSDKELQIDQCNMRRSYQYDQHHKKFVLFSVLTLLCSSAAALSTLIGLGFIATILCISLAIIFLICAIHHNQNLSEAQQEDKRINSIIDKEIETIEQTRKTAITQCSSLLSLIPDDYQSPEAIHYMLKIVAVGRATTLADATREWDEEAHRRRIEELQNQQLQSQLRQEKLAKQTRNIQAINLATTLYNAKKLDDIDDKL